MRKQAMELLAIAKTLTAIPMSKGEPDTQTVRWAKQNLMLTLRVDSSWKQIYDLFMTIQEGTSNKFHYFGVWRSKTGECVGGNAYGPIGYNPRAIEVARGREGSVMSAVRDKVSIKRRKGYETQEV